MDPVANSKTFYSKKEMTQLKTDIREAKEKAD